MCLTFHWITKSPPSFTFHAICLFVFCSSQTTTCEEDVQIWDAEIVDADMWGTHILEDAIW